MDEPWSGRNDTRRGRKIVQLWGDSMDLTSLGWGPFDSHLRGRFARREVGRKGHRERIPTLSATVSVWG